VIPCKLVQGRISLEAAVAKEPPPLPSDSGDAATDAMMDAALKRMDLAVKGFYLTDRAESTLSALEAIARHLSGVQGRKNLIWVSAAFPAIFLDGMGGGMPVYRSMNREVNRAARAIADADVAVYPVDARGLVPTIKSMTSMPEAPRSVFNSLSTIMPNIDTMRLTADLTGGRAYFNTNDLGGAEASRSVGERVALSRKVATHENGAGLRRRHQPATRRSVCGS